MGWGPQCSLHSSCTVVRGGARQLGVGRERVQGAGPAGVAPTGSVWKFRTDAASCRWFSGVGLQRICWLLMSWYVWAGEPGRLGRGTQAAGGVGARRLRWLAC